MTSSKRDVIAFKRDVTALAQQQFDVVIVGGGISGAWLALHCAQQGHSTALIEKGDYASQTSSSSSKLLHGGIRYLQQMQFGKVRESAMERAHYLYAAPHLSTAVPFVIPTYRDFQRSKVFLNCGMLAYRFLCLGENSLIDSPEQELPPIKSLSAQQLNSICDLSHERHTGAVVFYERHMVDSERMVLAILQSAKELGAQIHNYVSSTGFLIENNKVIGLSAQDELSGDQFEVKSKLVINAAGPWVDSLNSHLPKADEAPSINGFAVGSHIVTRQICDHAVGITTKHQSDAKIDRGGRHVFIIPWRGYSLIGTSYDEVDSLHGEIRIEADHVNQLLEAVNDGIPSAKLCRDDLVSGYSGLYPLRTDNIQSTVYQGSGEYQIVDHAKANGVSGLITALGAKFTTGRKLSALTMKLVSEKVGGSSKPFKTKLVGSQYTSIADFTKSTVRRYEGRFEPTTIRHLIATYGSEIDAFIECIDAPDLELPICSSQPDIFAQVTWAIQKEQAVRLMDVIFNRTSLGLLGILPEELDRVAELMARELGWDEKHKKYELNATRKRLTDTRAALTDEKND